MANIPTIDVTSSVQKQDIGPLVDDGAPYSAIGLTELHILKDQLLSNFTGKLDTIPTSLNVRTFWQYGCGNHASAKRRILGSILLTALSDDCSPIHIRHLVLEGSSQWLIGRNITGKSNIMHIGTNAIVFAGPNHSTKSITMVDHDLHSYVPYVAFSRAATGKHQSASLNSLCASSTHATETRPWSEVKRIIDKVHKHISGHASFSDIRTLLERNDMWSKEVEKYLSRTVETCHGCRATSLPKPSRKVSLTSLHHHFNDVVCIDHFHLDGLRIFHIMDAWSRYSAGHVVKDATIKSAIETFEAA